jgi:hypothetical protein
VPNATALVKKSTVSWANEFIVRSSETLAAETTYYTNAMVGIDTSGYVSKFDDTESMVFFGVVRGKEGDPVLPIGTAGADALMLDVYQPKRFELAIASVAVTDIGKKVYALDDQTGTLASTTVFGNLIGHVVDVVKSGIALVEPAYDETAGNQRYGAARTMAATGAQSLTKYDIGKTILLPNTAAYALTLPAVADTQAGDTLVFVKTTAAAFAVTLTGNAAETIDGSNTLATIDAQFDCATLVSTGAAWIVVSRDIT